MSTELYRFGLFELDAAANELRRDGVLVRLQAQPAQVLAVLVRNAGSVVTREALREAIWGSDTFVDFDRNLNYCVTQIRSALGDSADSPRFIRTHPKKGYAFIAPVTSVNGKAPEPRRWNGRKLAFLGTALALLAIGLLLGSRNLREAAGPITIAVVRFDNESTNPELTRFADGLTDMLVADLTQSGSDFAVIGNAAALRLPRKERNLKQIAADLQAHYLIFGQVFSDEGNRVRVLAHFIRLPDQKHLWVTKAEAENKAGDLAVQAEFARRITADIRARLPHTSR
ncbi:MAG: winged helix-turn-helix domain-containing protein [Acidobacteria bacterium]|nr:winged helix-turn-helix domain-containing protein [Acidobacteriota bacterium]